MLNNRLEEDEILGINHDGSLQSRIVGQPPMFELILSKEPKLTLEVTVLKAYTTMQVRTGIPFELLQLVVFAFSHEIYPASARWEPKTALSGEFSSWLEFLAKSPDVEQIKISRTSVINELFSWWRPWSQRDDSPGCGAMSVEEKRQLLWGIPNVSNSLRFLGMLNLALDLCSLATAAATAPRLATESHEFFIPMGVYKKIKRKSQALKAEKVQLTAGDGFIYMILRRRPKSKQRLLWQTFVGYGEQESAEQKFANQEAFGAIEAAVARLLAAVGLGSEAVGLGSPADAIYGALLEELHAPQGTQAAADGRLSAERLAAMLRAEAAQEHTASFLEEIREPLAHFAGCEPLAGLKGLLAD